MMLKGKWDNVEWGEDFVRGKGDNGTTDGGGDKKSITLKCLKMT